MAVMGSTATVTHSVVDDVNFTFACYPGGRGRRPPAYPEGFPCLESFQRALLCRGNFFISKSWRVSSHHLEPFWARISVYRAEQAYRPFSIVAAWGPFKRAKPAAWDPPPRPLNRAYSERFCWGNSACLNPCGGSVAIRFLIPQLSGSYHAEP